MKRGWGPVIVLAVAVVVVFTIAFFHILPHTDDEAITGLAVGQTAQFEGITVHFPEPWKKFNPGSRNGMLVLKKDGSANGESLVFEDERRHPEDTHHFVDGWMNAANNPGFHPVDIGPYQDPATDAVHMPCVAMHWPDKRRPLQLVCVASDGRWKLTLTGTDADRPALDALADQMPEFQRGLL